MSNLSALDELLAARPSADPLLAALARSLAAAIDAAPETGLAALAKEYRATLKELAGDAGPDPFSALLAEMGNAS